MKKAPKMVFLTMFVLLLAAGLVACDSNYEAPEIPAPQNENSSIAVADEQSPAAASTPSPTAPPESPAPLQEPETAPESTTVTAPEIPAYITIQGRQFSTAETNLNFGFDMPLTDADTAHLRYMVNTTGLNLQESDLTDISFIRYILQIGHLWLT